MAHGACGSLKKKYEKWSKICRSAVQEIENPEDLGLERYDLYLELREVGFGDLAVHLSRARARV